MYTSYQNITPSYHCRSVGGGNKGCSVFLDTISVICVFITNIFWCCWQSPGFMCTFDCYCNNCRPKGSYEIFHFVYICIKVSQNKIMSFYTPIFWWDVFGYGSVCLSIHLSISSVSNDIQFTSQKHFKFRCKVLWDMSVDTIEMKHISINICIMSQ